MVLNRDYEMKQTFSLSLKAPSRLWEVSREDGLQHLAAERTGTLEVALEAGDMAFFRVQDAAEEAFAVEYDLEKAARNDL